MPNSQLLPITILGLNQRSPRSGGVTGTLAVAENCIFEKGDDDGLLPQKRKGIDDLGGVPTTGAIAGSFGIFGRDSTIYQMAESALYSYVRSVGKWAPVGTQAPGYLSADVEGAGPAYVECTDSAASDSGFRVVAYESLATPRGVYVTLIAPDGGRIVQDKQISATGIRPKVAAVGDTFAVSWLINDNPGVSSTLYAMLIASDGTLTGPITVDSFVAAVDGLIQQGWHDVTPRLSGTFLYAYNASGSGTVYTREMQTNGTVGFSVSTGGNGDTGGAFASVDVPGAVSGAYIDLGTVSGAAAWCVRIDSATRFGLGTMSISVATIRTNITGAWDPSTKRTWFAIECTDNSGLGLWTNTRIVNAWVSQDFLTTVTAELKRSVGLASKAVSTGNTIVAMACHAEPLYQASLTGVGDALTQNTFFMLDIVSGNIVGTSLVNQAGGIESMTISEVDTLPHRSTLPRLELEGDAYVVCAKRISELAAGGVYKVQYRQPALLRWSRAKCSRPFVADDVTFIPGGMPACFDGANITPTFLAAPPALIPLRTAKIKPGVAPLDIGTYTWVYLWAWADEQGDVHRSRPSPPVSLTTTAGNQAAELTLSMYRLTSMRAADATPSNTNMPRAWLEVYRTSLTDPTLRLVSAVDPYVVNNPSIDNYVYVEATSDTAQAQGQPLYTQIEIEHTPPPPARAATYWQGRVVLSSLDDPGTLVLSFPKQAGFGITWGELITFRLPGGQVSVQELSVMDDKLVVWCSDRIYFVSGQPPNNLGDGSTLAALEIPLQFGVTGPGLVATTDKGLMYWTDNGPYLLGRDGSQSYVGSVLHDLRASEASEIVASNAQSRVFIFTTDQGAIVWDTVFGVWSTFTRHEAYRACEVAGRLTWLPPLPDGSARQSSDGFQDVGGAYVSMRLALNDVNFGAIEGYQVCWQCILIGEYVEEHKLNVDVVYDYRSPISVTQHFEREIGPDFPEPYATSALYGTLTPYAGSGDGVYQYPMFFKNIYCSAIRLEIWDEKATSNPSAPNGAGFKLAALVLEVGTIKGPNRIGTQKRLSSG